MNAYALHAGDRRGDATRWSLSAILIVALHAALIAAAILWARTSTTPGVSVPTILIDMSPASASPEPQQMDVAPGPQMEEADAPAAPPPEPVTQAPPEQIAPTPLQEKPEVVAPPEQKPQPTPPKPEPNKVTPEPPKPQVKPKPVQAQPKKQSERPPAPRTSAAPSAEKRAPQAAAMAGAAAAAALPSYRQMLAAHLQRFKQYPAAAKSAGITGTAMLSFTVTRSGGVGGARLSGSSGNAALDAETMAMIRRAQPLPAFLPQMTQASLSFTVPVRFSLGN